MPRVLGGAKAAPRLGPVLPWLCWTSRWRMRVAGGELSLTGQIVSDSGCPTLDAARMRFAF